MFLLCSYSGSSQPARRTPGGGGQTGPTGSHPEKPEDEAGGLQACLPKHTLVSARPSPLGFMVKHIIRNDGVTGSSPVSGTSTFPRTSLSILQLKGLSRGNGNGSSLGHFGKGKWLNRGDISLGLLEFADDPIWQRTCIAPCVTTPVGCLRLSASGLRIKEVNIGQSAKAPFLQNRYGSALPDDG